MTVTDLRNKLKSQFQEKEFEAIAIETDFSKERLIENGSSFFPYGRGLLNKGEEIPEGCIFFLGHDWGHTKYNEKIHKTGKGEDDFPTVRNLKKLVANDDQVFMTNIFMGLRIFEEKEKHSNTRLFSAFGKPKGGYKDLIEEYQKQCLLFLKVQIEEVRPRKIITLGTKVDDFVKKNLIGEVFNHDKIYKVIHPCFLPTNLIKFIKKEGKINEVSGERLDQEIQKLKEKIWKI